MGRRLRRVSIAALGVAAAATLTGCQSNLRFIGPSGARIVSGFGPGQTVTFESVDPCPPPPLGYQSVVALSVTLDGQWAIGSGILATNPNGSWIAPIEMPHNSGLPDATVWAAGDATVTATCSGWSASNDVFNTAFYTARSLKVVK